MRRLGRSSDYGSPRHPARDPIAAPVKGRASGMNTRVQPVLANGPSAQSIAQMQTLALATNTASPMARGMRIWAEPQDGYNNTRLTGRLDPRYVEGVNSVSGVDNAVLAIRPVLHPVSVRINFQSGASQQPAYPGTGQATNFGSDLAWMSLGQMGTGLGA